MQPVIEVKPRVNENDIEPKHRRSPKGAYEAYGRDVTRTLGAYDGAAKPPFDVELVRIPPGAALCPLHAHTLEWEHYIVISGQGTLVGHERRIVLNPGDHALQPPGSAHQIRNDGGEDLVYYVIANNEPAEVCYYPNSQKWLIDGPGVKADKLFRMTEIDYFDGEE